MFGFPGDFSQLAVEVILLWFAIQFGICALKELLLFVPAFLTLSLMSDYIVIIFRKYRLLTTRLVN